ncbi:MAG: hypothetical protein J6X79_02845 [Bacteroidales bacterium]|nr:hypothetical protein [Bacteroidales bacterium]
MKKGWKIVLISVGSLLGLMVVTVAVALWLVFTPSQLTKIVNRLATNYVNCETHFGKVNLTLFKTFPDAGLQIDDVYVVNPVEGAPSDTVARIGNLTVGVDVKKYLKEKEVIVHQVLLDDVVASLYIDSAGHSNFDIFPHSDDKDTVKKPFSLDSLPNMDLKKIKVSDLNANLHNDQGHMDATVDDLDLSVVGTLKEGRVAAKLNLDGDLVALCTKDSIGATTVDALLEDITLALEAEGCPEELLGDLSLKVKKGRFNNLVNEKLQASKHDLLKLEMPFNADLLNMQFLLDDSRLQIDDYALGLKADVRLDPMNIDAVVTTDGAWQVAPLLELLPMQVLPKGMDVDGKVKLQAYACGEPAALKVNANVGLADGRFHYPQALPYKVNRICGDFDASVDLSKKTPSNVKIKSLKAHTINSNVSVNGQVDNLLGDMLIDAYVKGALPLEDAQPMVPDSLKLTLSGAADVDIHAHFKMSQLRAQDYEHMAATGRLDFKGLDVVFDSIHATADALALNLQLPAKEHAGKLADTRLTAGVLKLAMPGIEGTLDNPDINLGVNNPLKEQLAAAVELSLGKSSLNLDSSRVDLVALSLDGSVRLDSNGTTIFNKYNPRLNVAVKDGMVASPTLAETAYLNKFDFRYSPERCEVVDADIMFANSDFQLYGSLENLESWLEHKAMLVGDLNLTSNYTDVDQILALVSGMGSNADTLEQMRREDNVPQEANPFIVPKDVDVTLHTHIKRSLAFGNDLGDLAGAVTVKDGIAVLDQIGFVCKAATMQLTAIYKSPRPSHLFTAIDFHLLDIQIDELLNMIPVVDTLVPMLAAFEGNANFHLAAETYLNASYQPLMSSLKGAAAISGTDLTVMDNNSIAQIAKLMQFKSWKDKDNKIKIDSLDVELTCLNKVIEVYPFLLTLGKYQICASGMHSLDNQCGYHLELLKNPLLARVGVDVKGSLSNPKISLGEVRYADFFRPDKQGVVEKQTLELKRQVKQALEAKVR